TPQMRHLLISTGIAMLAVVCAASIANAAIRRGSPPASFPRVVREEFVSRLAAKVTPLVEIEPQKDYRPGCCFDATADSTCRIDDGNAMCWLDAGDGCGPVLDESGQIAAYWPEDAKVASASSPKWGEVSRQEQRRSIREILHVLAERQPARPVGLAAYAVGFV